MKKSDINILVVEDDRNLGAVLVEAITRSGYKAIHALRSEDALASVKIKTIHAAVIDCMLPKMNGVSLAQSLRSENLKTEPIIFMSGIYKDKGFAMDALQKTNAIDFLVKPFDINHLINLLEENLKHLISAPKLALHSLLSTPFSSSRDRRKAIEQVDEIYGFDLPFILSVFLEDQFCGHINLVNDAQEMFGFTLYKSYITSVDSIDSVSSLSLMLVNSGHLSREDLKEIQKAELKGDFLKSVIDSGYLSPHAAENAINLYILEELDRLICDEMYKISISPDRKIKAQENGVSLNDFTKLYWTLLEERVPSQWFENFYKEWNEHALRHGPQFEDRKALAKIISDKQFNKILEFVNTEPTLTDVLKEFDEDKMSVLRTIHCLCSRRIFVFDVEKKSTNWSEIKQRNKKLLKEIENKGPEDVFIAMGLQKPLRTTEVTKVYKDFAKFNHPDKMEESKDAELKEIVKKVFSILSEAHHILTDDTRRESYKKNVQQKNIEEQINAERFLDEVPKLISQGRYSEAEHMARISYEALQNDESKLVLASTLIRDGATEAEIKEADSLLGDIAFEGRRTELYWIVSGKLAFKINDHEGAANHFRKAIEANPQSLEARRGLMRVQAASSKSGKNLDFSKMSATEILNADLGDLTKKFFKKHFG